MRLVSLKYMQDEGTDRIWVLDSFTFGQTNLIVGKNATGKSRILAVINGLAKMLTGQARPLLSGDYDASFKHLGKTYRYLLKYHETMVVKERLTIDKKIYLARKPGGFGKIFAEKVGKGKLVKFQSPPSEIAAITRRDKTQHAFLEPLYEWASSVRAFHFGTPLGKDRLVVFHKETLVELDDTDTNQVASIFNKGINELGNPFKKSILKDMREIHYNLEDVSLNPFVSIRIRTFLPGEVLGIAVKEESLPSITDQNDMSQGMFRALSVIIQLNYALLTHKANTFLIDDVGEGLDFDRSVQLIELLRRKAREASVQLVMATNDRFVMNRVPLEDWSLLEREGSKVHVRNYQNSKAIFEEFKFTGLSNFSFLEMDFVNGPPAEGAAAHE